MQVEESLEGMPFQFGQVRIQNCPLYTRMIKKGFAQHRGSIQEITVEGDNKLKLDRVVGATGLIVGSFGSA